METITIPNSYQQNIAAVVHRPRLATEKLAILCPGFLDSKNYDHLRMLADELTQNGYTSVRFDPTGTWESEGDISEYVTSQYIQDIKSVLEHMLLEGAFTHVLLGGHSRGGQVSFLYAARDPRISVALGIMPSYGSVVGKRREDWEASKVKTSSRELPFDKTQTRTFSVPFEHVLDRDQFDAFADVDKIAAPKIFLAGEHDILVPPDRVRALFDHAHEPKTFILAKGIDHEYRQNLNDITKVNALILEALAELF